VICCGAITPHFFQPVEFSCLRLHDMHHYIHIIDKDPLQLLESFMVIGILPAVFLYMVFHVVCNGPDLWLAASFTDDKKISHCLIYFSQVKGNNMLALFFLDRCNNGFDEL